MADDLSNRIIATSTLIDKLSQSNLSKIIVAAFFGVLIYAIFEQRTIILSAIIGSPSMAVVFGVVILILIIFVILNQLYQIQQDRIIHLERQVAEDHIKILDILHRVEGQHDK
jgi:FtsH-binding integral membrane protein